jgi:putative CocE/NonD family hydrolase
MKLICGLVCILLVAVTSQAQVNQTAYLEYPSEIPEKFIAPTDQFDYVKRIEAIPMRDGVKLNTVILIPKVPDGGLVNNAPILLTRTPYSANQLTGLAESSHLASILQGYDNAADVIVEGGYIRVMQDVRGKYDSEGDYVLGRPLHGSLNPTLVDNSTDAWDTIEWLSKNIPESNGKVGILGISYDGYLTLMALVNPHPALKVAVPMNPMVDGWRGDDWFHYGAFRQINLRYILDQVATRKNEVTWFTSHFDDYDVFMRAGSAGELARQRGLEQIGFWRKLAAHPSYDIFWREQAVDKTLAKQPVAVPTMLVHSLWDAEDIYGDMAVYKAIKAKDLRNDKIFLVIGPWSHGGEIEDGSSLGAIRFNSDTALHFRQEFLRPFLDHYLRDDAPKLNIAPVNAFETGTNTWRSLDKWPAGCVNGCVIKPTPLHLVSKQQASFKPSTIAGYDEYIADPAKPVPYRTRPIPPCCYDESKGQTWSRWLVDDQREASGRTDVLSFTTEVLTTPVKISGEPIANLVASTSGTDSDWVVKVIDVYPDEVARQPAMGGYQLMISADIFRGRYRESFEVPKPLLANQALTYRFALPTANHVFLPGHRIMVQIQSSWFPLYDRNPQTFVPNIFWAKPGEYKKATQRIYYGPQQDSFIDLPIVEIAH